MKKKLKKTPWPLALVLLVALIPASIITGIIWIVIQAVFSLGSKKEKETLFI